MGVSKVIYGGNTLIDLTADTIKADKLLSGYTAHGADGEAINGSCTFDANTQDATAAAAEILSSKTAYNKGVKITGTMPNRGGFKGDITEYDVAVTIPQGYHDGSGKIGIDAGQQKLIKPSNIREGVEILGVVGTMSGSEDVKAQSKSATPSTTQQVIVPDATYTHLSQVTVAPIPYVESDNSAGGKTVTIA